MLSNNKPVQNLQIPVKVKSLPKFQNVPIKSEYADCIQTVLEEQSSCKYHSEQITELLTQIAITLSHKARLENQLVEMKKSASATKLEMCEMRQQFLQQIEFLKRNNEEKEKLLMKQKISHLEEQKMLLTEINQLKTTIQNAKEMHEMACEELRREKQVLEEKVKKQQESLQLAADRNVLLLQKANKYKSKLRNLTANIKQLQDIQTPPPPPQVAKEEEHNSTMMTATSRKTYNNAEENMENLLLTELFFKPNPIPADIAPLFFRKI